MTKVNDEIREKSIVLVSSEDGSTEDMSLSEAKRRAEAANLDLVEVGIRADGAGVCKLMNYSKYLYQQNKKRVKEKRVEVKEIRLTWKISEHDLEVKLKAIRRIIDKDKDKVKVTVQFKGREIKMQSEGFKLLDKIREALKSDNITSTASKVVGVNVCAVFEKR